jgi:hypothetical protein
MTLPDERYRAVRSAERFLREVAHDTKKYPRVSNAVRQEAASILRHFPTEHEMQLAANGVPDVFQERMKSVYK